MVSAGWIAAKKAAHFDYLTNDWPLMPSRQVLIVKTLQVALNLAETARLVVRHLGHHRLATFQKCVHLFRSLFFFQFPDRNHLFDEPDLALFTNSFPIEYHSGECP